MLTNRLGSLQSLTDDASALDDRPDASLGIASYAPGVGTHPTAYFAPLHYEPNYAYPLIVWLHGPGDSEGQLKRIMPLVSLRNYVSVAIRGTAPFLGATGKPGFAWSQAAAHVALAEQALFDTLEAARRKFHLAPHRVFLAGFDCGGTMAFRLAMTHPRQFAGVVSFGGEFPVGGAPLVRLSEARHVPIFLACGRDSQRYPSTIVCDNLKLFHSAGMNVALRQYPCGHELMPLMLADMDRWIMEQISGTQLRTGCAGQG